ncbi:MAG: hypothetical protein LBC84_10110 [Prevotellaceae bacterium]|nr:hypothetical protein [Prevotellaceae bacterium]
MTKRIFNLRKVATIDACLAVTTMFIGCKKSGWPSSSTLAKYGLDGLNKRQP